jgi:hypothetical protein
MFVTALRAGCFAAAILLAGCGGSRERPIGEGYVAPAALNLRKDLGPRQPMVGEVRHGERVEILERRRRFVRVRTSTDVVGWIDGDLLFGQEQMEELWALGRWAASLPSQGQATSLELLNVHTAPAREAPSFQQLREDARADVVAHRWVSGPDRTEDWSLVRLSATEAGWVLTRMLYMNIPDEVAQYAEGHRIMSCFSLGEVKDGDQVKQHWLWTTLSGAGQPHDFDGIRLFVWSVRRHRYETAFRERRLKGYYPIQVTSAEGGGRHFEVTGMSSDGSWARYVWAFDSGRVRTVSKTPCAPPQPISWPPAAATAKAQLDKKSFFGRIGAGIAGAWRRFF